MPGRPMSSTSRSNGDAVVQLTPYLVAAYEVVPRWVTIGVLGLALLVSGATYEQRVRDLRRVGKHVARLG